MTNPEALTPDMKALNRQYPHPHKPVEKCYICSLLAERAARQTPDTSGLRLDRWVESLREDANGLVWTTKAEIRAALAALAATERPLDVELWHGDGDQCLGSECLSIDEATGDHDTDLHSGEWWDGFAEAGRRIARLTEGG